MEFYKDEHTSFHYTYQTSGKPTLLAFHGFGQNPEFYLPLQKSIVDKYDVLSISLVGHAIPFDFNQALIEPNNYVKSIDSLLHKLGINDSIQLLGYSIGGRIALNFLKHTRLTVIKTILIAPDGFHMRLPYLFLTKTTLGNYLFKQNLKHPHFLISVLKLACLFKLISPALKKFATLQLSNADLCSKIYKSWTGYAYFWPPKRQLVALVNKHEIQFILGKYDAIIPFDQFKNIPDTQKTIVLSGHKLLNQKTDRHIIENDLF